MTPDSFLAALFLALDPIKDIFLPVALGIIMFGMGLSLTLKDFRNVGLAPRAAVIGLLFQLVGLPLLAWGVVELFGLQEMWAVGLLLLAFCPGGTTSNFITHLLRGDTALSISLTAINSLVIIVTIPLLLGLALDTYLGKNQTVELNALQMILQVLAVTLVPVALGMMVNNRSPKTAKAMDKPVRWVSIVFFAVIVIGAVLKNRKLLADNAGELLLPALALNALALLLGFLGGRLLGLRRSQRITLAVEVGIQNGTLAIMIAGTVLNIEPLMIPPAVYSLLMFVTAGIFGLYLRLAGRAAARTASAS